MGHSTNGLLVRILGVHIIDRLVPTMHLHFSLVWALASLKLFTGYCSECQRWSLLLLLLIRFSRVRLGAIPKMAAHQAPPSLGFSRQNTGVGCHFLLQCMKVKSEVGQSCLTLSDPMDCSLPGSSVHGIFQATVLEWGVIAFSEVQSRSQQIDQSKGWSQTIGAKYQFQVSQSMQNTDLEYANQSNVHARS